MCPLPMRSKDVKIKLQINSCISDSISMKVVFVVFKVLSIIEFIIIIINMSSFVDFSI